MTYLIFIILCLSSAREILLAIRKKNCGNLILSILLVSFFFAFFVGLLSGGSALHDAKNEYDLYQAGHYYLVSHGNWTEVSRGTYMLVLVSEVIGFASLGLTFLLCILRDWKRKRPAS